MRVYDFEVVKTEPHIGTKDHGERLLEKLPRPTASFRRRAWLDFQRALDPLGPPKPLPLSRQRT